MIKILFVCHGNICRSPMAEFIFKDIIKKNGAEDKFFVSSCATSSEEIWNGKGNPVYPLAKLELKKHGITCDGKFAVQIQEDDYNKYGYIIGMDSYNIKNINRIFVNDSKSKIYKLLSFAGLDRDVDDPWYTRDFEKCFSDILLGCSALFDYIKNKSNCK